MKSFYALLFAAAVQGQLTDNAGADAPFKGTAADFNTTDISQSIVDIVVGSTSSDPSLVGTIAWYVSEEGINFLGFKLELYAPAANFAVGAYNSVYF